MRSFLFACLLILFLPALHAQVTDSILTPKTDTLQVSYKNLYTPLLDSNIFLHGKGTPQAFPVQTRKTDDREFFFYVILGLLFLLGLMRTLYSRYFNTLFRVFFNTSLRQNQLTDQLEQAGLQSFIFNLYFIITAGFYVYFLLDHFSFKHSGPDWWLAGLCILAVAACYLVKYISLRFAGWVTNCSAETSTYIFIVFLLNKVIGILLLPFLVIIAFSTKELSSYAVFISLVLLGLVLLLRFFRSYSLLQNRLRITAFHFLLYIIALEILPIALIYKAVMLFFSINS